MFLEKIVVGPLEVNCFIVACDKTKKCAIIDPGDESSKIISAIRAENLTPEMILITHGHFDHLAAANAVKQEFQIPILIHQADKILAENASVQASMFGMEDPGNVSPDKLLQHGNSLQLGKLQIDVIHTPGHSPGNVTFKIGSHLFVGDLIFQSSIGRTDLPGGNYQQLINSVEEKIFTFPDNYTIHPGHGPDTTVGIEKRNNPFF